MLKQDQASALSTHVRNSQVITFGLIMGVTLFAGVLLVQVPIAGFNQNFSWLVLFGMVMALTAVAVSVVLPRVIRQSAAQQLAARLHDQNKLVDDHETIMECANQFLTYTIVRNAFLEGACLLNLTLFLLEHSLVSLGIAMVLLLFMVAGFPTTGRVVGWIETQLDSVRDQLRETPQR